MMEMICDAVAEVLVVYNSWIFLVRNCSGFMGVLHHSLFTNISATMSKHFGFHPLSQDTIKNEGWMDTPIIMLRKVTILTPNTCTMCPLYNPSTYFRICTFTSTFQAHI